MERPRGDTDWMRVALNLAKRGLGTTWPNPSVGCVIVKDGRAVGRGHTQAGGRPHAEIVALAQAGDAAKGATAYVTLEPCSHHGKSPPCTDALIAAGVAKVVVAQSDPNPLVDGMAALKAAGIAVQNGICTQEAAALNAGFTSVITKARPRISLKIATTLDGKIATSTGESRWITGPAARRRVHMMRATHDAVMVGRGTVEADDPMLDIRDMGRLINPVRVVLDSKLRISKDARVVKTARAIPTWIIHRDGTQNSALSDAGCDLLPVPAPKGCIDLHQAMTTLAQKGLTRILCEGGGTLAASLLRANLVDELIVFNAGKMIGADGLSAVAALRLAALKDAPQFGLVHQEQIGADIMTVWTPT